MPSESDVDSHRSLLRLERKVALYERTLGLAVLPVLVRRLAIAVTRPFSDRAPSRENPIDRPDSRVWIEARPHETGRFKMFLDPHSVGHGAREMVLGTYDDTFLDALRPLSALQGAVIWDVGAHVGYESLVFASLVGPSGRVVAFEPNPANLVEWQKNADANADLAPRMNLQAIALSAEPGMAAFRFSDDVVGGRSSGSHLADSVPPEQELSYAAFRLVDVVCARADDLVEAGEIAPPSFIKIDVEGAEADVIRGAVRTLGRYRPALLVEVHHVRAMHDVGVLLQEAGYVSSLLQTPEESVSRCFLKAVRTK